MTVAVVGGTGDLGFGLALRLAKAGQEVVIGSRSSEKAADAVTRAWAVLGEDAPVDGTTNDDAVGQSEIVFVTVPFAGQADTYRSLKDHWVEGSIVCDTTTPLATAVGGRATQILRPWQGSAAEQAKSLLPKHVRLVSGFHSIGAEPLEAVEHEVASDVLLCGDDAEAKATIGGLVDLVPGMRWVDVGRLAMARVIEPLTAMLISVNRKYGLKDTGVRLSGRDTWSAPQK
ncbi:MAG TPA: NADPH-dependent F420 reductase [Actinomycetota bacterium]|nr:NADPH-dependent F420 reductase [Actinomycetota bacterium]